MTFYQIKDVCDALIIGDIYRSEPAGRLVKMTNTRTNTVLHVYKHTLDHGVLRGAVTQYDPTQSERMHCDVVARLCHSTTTKYIY